MKLFNYEQILGLKHAIEEGFKNGGLTLTERERQIISLTIDSIIIAIEKIEDQME